MKRARDLRASVVIGAAAALVAGCGAFRLPAPMDPPRQVGAGEKCPMFVVRTSLKVPSSPADFAGRPTVLVGADVEFVGELCQWLEFIAGRHDLLGDRLNVVPILEGGRKDGPPRGRLPRGCNDFLFDTTHRRWERLSRDLAEARRRARDLEINDDRGAKAVRRRIAQLEAEGQGERRGFRRAFGFVGEGPHVVALDADSRVVATLDGPCEGARAAALESALDSLLGEPEAPVAAGDSPLP